MSDPDDQDPWGPEPRSHADRAFFDQPLAFEELERPVDLEARLELVAKALDARIELVAVATRDAIEAAQARTAEAVKSELALFATALQQRDLPVGVTPEDLERLSEQLREADPLAGLQEDLRGELQTALERAVEDTAAAVRLDLAVLRAEVVAAAGAQQERDEGQHAMLRTEVRRVMNRAAVDTLAAVRTDIAELQRALRSTAAEARTTETESLTAWRDESRTVVEGAIREVLGGLPDEVAAIRSTLGAMEQSATASAAGVAELFTARNDQMEVVEQLRDSLGRALLEEAQARESAHELTRNLLQSTVQGLEARLTTELEATATTQRESRTVVEGAIREVLGGLPDEVAAIRSTIGAMEQSATASAAGVAELFTARNDQIEVVEELRDSLGRALLDEATARESAHELTRDLLQSTVQGLEARLTTELEATATTQRGTRTLLRETIGRTAGELASLRSEQLDGFGSLRTELADGLESLRKLTVGTARVEAQARTEELTAVRRQIDELTGAVSELVKTQIRLRETLIERLGL